ncbi:MAG: GNAT family N-acetyltransferase [Tessaracoccus sp.]
MLDANLLPLRAERVVLRAMRAADASAYATGTKDTAVRDYAHLPEPEYTEATVTALIRGSIRDGLERGDLAVLTIADPATDEFAGSLVLFGVTDDSVEVGFWVHPDHRGKGLAGASLALAVEFARGSGLTRLTARTVPENQASQSVLESVGFARGEQTHDIAPSGEEVALLHYSRQVAPTPG